MSLHSKPVLVPTSDSDDVSKVELKIESGIALVVSGAQSDTIQDNLDKKKLN